jgi:polyisoprenoid-binding protein YceI
VARLILCATLLALAEPVIEAEPRAWEIDYGASRLEFVAEQAGAAFRGRFERFTADIRFDPEALDASAAVVRIDTASVATFDAERDGILTGDGWFESARFPEARFEVARFEPLDGGFRAEGTLTIRDVQVPVTFDFEPTPAGLRGHAVLDRLAFGLGAGEWADPQWIGHSVGVEVEIVRFGRVGPH